MKMQIGIVDRRHLVPFVNCPGCFDQALVD